MSLSFSDAAKAKQLREYFNRHGRIYIVVDATRDDVIVPESLHGDPALRLVLNMRMPQIIRIRDDRLDSDFSFSGQIFSCQLPMQAIWAAYLPEGELEQGIIWDDSVPELIKAIVQTVRSNMSADETEKNVQALKDKQQTTQPDHEKPVASKVAVASTISVIEGGGGEHKAGGSKKRQGSHLRVVK